MRYPPLTKISLLILCIAFVQFLRIPADAAPTTETTVVAKQTPEGTALVFTLKPSEDITVYEANLPWGIRTSIILAAYAVNPGHEILDPILYISDPGPGVATLRKDQTYTGTILLKHRFESFEEALRQKDILIFWSYQLELMKEGHADRESGSFLIPKTAK